MRRVAEAGSALFFCPFADRQDTHSIAQPIRRDCQDTHRDRKILCERSVGDM